MKAEWFAGRLRELREAAGLTQQQLALRASMAWRTITHLEGGDRKPSWETVLALCQALGVSPEAFLQEPADRPPPGRGRPRKNASGDAGRGQARLPRGAAGGGGRGKKGGRR